MMSVTVKLKRRRVLIFAFLFVFILLLAVAAFFGKNADGFLFTQNRLAENTNDERIRFLSSFGWLTSSEPIIIDDVLIPAEFSDVYENYNQLQIENGYNLKDYKLKLVKKYTYEILNYPNIIDGEKVYANLLIYQNDIIGGDVSSAQLGGFMQGFSMP